MYKVFILFILFLFQACIKKDLKPAQARFCKQELALFTPEDSLKILKLDFEKSNDQIIKKIERKLKAKTCGNWVHFGLLLNNGEMIRLILDNEDCEINSISCWPVISNMTIILNKEDEVLIITKKESSRLENAGRAIQTFIKNNYTYINSSLMKEIAIEWQVGVSNEQVNRLFQAVLEGYLALYNKHSLENFGKTSCELDSAQFLKLQKDFSLYLRLGNWHRRIPPPPPPVISLPESSNSLTVSS